MAFFDLSLGTIWDDTLSVFTDILELGATPGEGELTGAVSGQVGEQVQAAQTAPAPTFSTFGVPAWVWAVAAFGLGIVFLPRLLK